MEKSDRYYIIDRFEGTFAVCEAGKTAAETTAKASMQRISRAELPPKCREGDMLCYVNGSWQVEEEETEKRRKHLEERLKHIRKKSE